MNKVRFLFAVVCAALILAGHKVQAQTSFQDIAFHLVGQYQTNAPGTNVSDSETNIFQYTPQILFNSINIVKALAVEVAGAKWTNWAGSTLVLEINLTNGNEGIFLRENGLQTNVSQYLGTSFSNNFTYDLTNAFPAVNNFVLTNYVTVTNDDTVTTNAVYTTNYPNPQIDRGWVFERPDTTNTTRYTAHYGLHFISFNTSNLQFNLLGTSYGFRALVAGSVDGIRYERSILGEAITSSGIFSLNTTTNILGTGEDPPVFLGGPIHGTLALTPPVFVAIPGP